MSLNPRDRIMIALKKQNVFNTVKELQDASNVKSNKISPVYLKELEKDGWVKITRDSQGRTEKIDISQKGVRDYDIGKPIYTGKKRKSPEKKAKTTKKKTPSQKAKEDWTKAEKEFLKRRVARFEKTGRITDVTIEDLSHDSLKAKRVLRYIFGELMTGSGHKRFFAMNPNRSSVRAFVHDLIDVI